MIGRAEAWVLVDRVFAAPRQRSSDPFGEPEGHSIKGLLLLNETKAGLQKRCRSGRSRRRARDANNNSGRLGKPEAALAKARIALAKS